MKTRLFFLTLLLIFSQTGLSVDKVLVLGLFKDKAVVMLDNKRHVLSVGESTPEGVKLISANSQEAVLEINGEQDTYTLGSRIGVNFKKPGKGATVTIAPDDRGSYHVNGSINGFQVDFLVDTGATLISMNRIQARRIGINYKLEGEEATSQTASGPATIYRVNLDRVRIGDIELRDVAGAVHDGDFPAVILLGNSFLSKLKIYREGQLMILEKK